MRKTILLCPVLILAGCQKPLLERMLPVPDSPIIITDGSIHVKKQNGFNVRPTDVRFNIKTTGFAVTLQKCDSTFTNCASLPGSDVKPKDDWDLKIKDPTGALVLELKYPDTITGKPDRSGIQLFNMGGQAAATEPPTKHDAHYDDVHYPDGAVGLLHQQYNFGGVSINGGADTPCSRNCRITIQPK